MTKLAIFLSLLGGFLLMKSNLSHAAVSSSTPSSMAAKIEELTTPAGIKLWLVRSHQIPMVSAEIAVRGGSAFDPENMPGLASFTASMLDEGAGSLPATAFQNALEDIGARLNINIDKTEISLNLDTLTEHREEAFRLLGMAATKPRFDAADVERVRAAILSNLSRVDENPRALLSRAVGPALFDKHPYAHPQDGFEWSMKAVSVKDMQGFHARAFTRSNMVVSMVGDIEPAEAMRLVDLALADMPAGNGKLAVAQNPSPTMPAIVRIEKDVPQANIVLGHLGLPRNHPDYFKLIVANELLGGSTMTSRLFKNVREAEGLAYDVRSTNMPYPGAGAFMLSIQTDNAKAQLALNLMRKQVTDLQKEVVSDAELADTIAYLVGSFPLRLDSNAKILGYLTLMQMEGLGRDYIEKWLQSVKAVSKADVQTIMQTYVRPENMALIMVGQGAALQAK
jgi:zinc protease